MPVRMLRMAVAGGDQRRAMLPPNRGECLPSVLSIPDFTNEASPSCEAISATGCILPRVQIRVGS
jgi:hypothetical protein